MSHALFEPTKCVYCKRSWVLFQIVDLSKVLAWQGFLSIATEREGKTSSCQKTGLTVCLAVWKLLIRVAWIIAVPVTRLERMPKQWDTAAACVGWPFIALYLICVSRLAFGARLGNNIISVEPFWMTCYSVAAVLTVRWYRPLRNSLNLPVDKRSLAAKRFQGSITRRNYNNSFISIYPLLSEKVDSHPKQFIVLFSVLWTRQEELTPDW